MRDKMIRDRRKSAASVISSVDAHLEVVVVPLEGIFAKFLEEGEELPDLRTLFRILQRMLTAAIEDLVEAADRHLDELDNDVGLRRQRDELIAYLRTKVGNLRKTLEGLYGKGSARILAGIEGRVEQEPVALLLQVERILDRFGDPELELDPAAFGSQVTAAGIVADFEPEYTRLKDLRLELTREDRRSDATVIAKGDAKTYYDQQFRWIAGCLAMLYHLAGQHELAERIKPSARRSGRTQADVEAEKAERAAEKAEPAAEPAGDSAEQADVSIEESATVEADAVS